MPARPTPGRTGRQEFYEGHAEDHFRVLSLHEPVRVPYTYAPNALLTKEWTPLEPGVVDHKFYVRGEAGRGQRGEAREGGGEHERSLPDRVAGERVFW